MAATPKEIILQAVNDLVTDFIYYDRKEDEVLQVGAIESAIENGQITVDEIVLEFRMRLTEALVW